jgi:hypothetical protein
MESKYDRYVVYVPKKSAPDAPFPSVTLMGNELVAGCDIDLMFNWILKRPEIDPEKPFGHSHDYDEIIANIGTDPKNAEDLGAEVVGFLGDERHTLHKTSAVFVPRNVEHGVIGYNRFERPYIQMAIKLGGSRQTMR